MRRTILTLACAALLGGLAACERHTGIVTEAGSGHPVAGARVVFADRAGRTQEVTTGGDGRFDVGGLGAGLHALTVSKAGFVSVTRPGVLDNGFDVTIALAQDPDTSDTDGDGLTGGEEAAFGTDASARDTDGDGLGDGAEARVIPPLGLPGFGVSPRHKDLLLELDWVGAAPASRVSPLATEVLRQNFARAPVPNPDGSPGVHLVIDDGGLGGGSGLGVDPVWGCDWSLQNPPAEVVAGLAPERRGVFYHSLSVGSFDCPQFGLALIDGPFLVFAGDQSAFGIAEPLVEAGIWQHEFGHNLGLLHGGDVNTNCKPNYPSVMNYNVLVAMTTLDFSRGGGADLDEAALDEAAGLGAGPMDWNRNGTIDPAPVAADVNNFRSLGPIGDLLEQLWPTRCTPDGTLEVLRDHDDWTGVTFPGAPGIPGITGGAGVVAEPGPFVLTAGTRSRLARIASSVRHLPPGDAATRVLQDANG